MVEKQHIWEMLAGYFADPTPEKEKELQQWLVKASPEEKKLYEETRNLWDTTSIDQGSFTPDVNRGWQRLQLKVSMREKEKVKIPYLKIAAAVLLLAVFSLVFLRNFNQQEMIEFTTFDEVKAVELPDGSKVWLNKYTTLTYASDYNSENREVYLEGEAFFEVKKAEGKRFTVFTEETMTEVIGTSFNVRAINNEPVVVQVATGKVAFASRDERSSVFLEPGEKAEYIQMKDSIGAAPIEDPNYRYWQNKELTFSNTSLEKLVETLEENFNTTIIISEELANCRFTASFENPELTEVLDVLKITGDFTIEQSGQGYTISGEGCK